MGNQDPKSETVDAFNKPKAGMRFHEMYTHWVYVLATPFGMVITRTFSGHPANPCKETIKYNSYLTVAAFQKAYRYDTIPGYWVRYCDNKAFSRMKEEVIVTEEELHPWYRD